jgi:hypothetical protein
VQHQERAAVRVCGVCHLPACHAASAEDPAPQAAHVPGGQVTKRKEAKEKPLYFSFVSKEKCQKKTAIDWTIAGSWTPNGVQPQVTVHYSNKKENQLPTPNLGRSWFSFASFLFTEKKRRDFFFWYLFFFLEKEKYITQETSQNSWRGCFPFPRR